MDSNKSEDRAWTTDEMRRESHNWTLAGDVGLLMFLQQFSQNMISKTHEMEKAVDELVHETKMTSAKVHNIINGFHMLSNTQFVETRVYDEDIQDKTPSQEKPEEPKTKEQREAELIPKIALALNLGLRVIDEAFDKVEIHANESDSEDEEGNYYVGGPLLEPKDPYIHRPLPYIIGSEAFNADDNIGLGEILNDSETKYGKESIEDIESEVSLEGSGSEFEDLGQEAWNMNSNAKPLYDGTAGIAQKKKAEPVGVIGASSSEDESSDLFAVDKRNGHVRGSASSISYEDEDDVEQDHLVNNTKAVEEQNNAHNLGPAGFKEELAAALGGNIKPKKPPPAAVKPEKKKPSSKRSSVSSTIVPPPDDGDEDEDEDSPFSKKGGGLFSGGGNLFGGRDDEDEEDGDLFGGSSYSSRTSSKVAPSGSFAQTFNKADLFGASSESAGPAAPEAKTESKPKQKDNVAPAQAGKKTQLSFLDDDDDDDDLFSSPVVPKKEQPKPERKTTSVLFGDDDEDDDDLFGAGGSATRRASAASTSTAETKKLPAGAVSLFGGASSELGAAIRSHKQQPSSDSESEVTTTTGEDITSSRTSLSSGKSSLQVSSSKQSSLEKEAPPSTTKTTTTKAKSLLLFSEEAEDDDDLFAADSKSRSTTSTSTASGSSTREKKQFMDGSFSASVEVPNTELAQNAPITSKGDALFGNETAEEASDDLFGSLKIGEKKKPQTTSLFSDGLFSSPPGAPSPSTKTESPTKKKALPKPAKKISLFDSDDDDDTEDDLFSSKKTDTSSLKSSKSFDAKGDMFSPSEDSISESVTAKAEPPAVATRPKSNSVFEDEDLLFGGSPSESPSVDLFAPSTSPKKPVGGVSLFGGVNLFAGDLGRKMQAQKEKEENSEGGGHGDEDVETSREEAPPQRSSPSPVLPPPPSLGLQDSVESSVSFDEPVNTSNTLSSANRDRAKIQTKRRLPSRKGRQARQALPAAEGVASDAVSSATTKQRTSPLSPSEASPTVLATSPTPPAVGSPRSFESLEDDALKVPRPNAADGKTANSFTSPSTEEDDLFAMMDPSPAILEPVKPGKAGKSVVDDLFADLDGTSGTDDDIFGPVSSSVINETKKDAESSDEIFSAGPKQKPIADLPSGDHKEDDIFETSILSSMAGGGSGQMAASDNLFDDDDDTEDIFADLAATKRDSWSKMTRSDSLFGDDKDDDDIFGTSSKAPSAASSSQASSKKAEESGASGVKKLPKSSSVQRVTGTDIFDDPLLKADDSD